jgi:hypothetical protein
VLGEGSSYRKPYRIRALHLAGASEPNPLTDRRRGLLLLENGNLGVLSGWRSVGAGYVWEGRVEEIPLARGLSTFSAEEAAQGVQTLARFLIREVG